MVYYFWLGAEAEDMLSHFLYELEEDYVTEK
jgi:hypothetical protein